MLQMRTFQSRRGFDRIIFQETRRKLSLRDTARLANYSLLLLVLLHSMVLLGGARNVGQGGAPPPAEWFRARQRDLGVLPAPGATILSGLGARPCPTTVTQGLFLPFALLSNFSTLRGCAPYPNKPRVAGREHGCCRRINSFCRCGTRPQTSANKECCSLPQAPCSACLTRRGRECCREAG